MSEGMVDRSWAVGGDIVEEAFNVDFLNNGMVLLFEAKAL